MDLKTALLKENSIKNIHRIVDYIGSDQYKFDELMLLFLDTQYRLTQRSANVVNLCSSRNPNLLEPYLEEIINLLAEKKEAAIIRNIVRLLQFVDIPENLLGIAFENCYALTLSNESPIAIKSFGIGILYNICKKEPDLKQEVAELVKMQLPGASSGLKNRCLRTLKNLEKL